jgi:hypothetical protein
MKTAAVIVLVVALIGLIPKKKKHEPPPPATTPITQSKHCTPPDKIEIDDVTVRRIVQHGKHLYRKQSQSDATLDRIARGIVKYTKMNCIEPELGAAIIARESGYNPNAVSPSGACGLGQMLPSTARKMGASDCFDIDQNLRGAMAYFRGLLDIWAGYDDQTDRALASYLLGPGTVKNHGGVPWNNGTVKTYINDIHNYRNKILSY